MNKCSRCKTEYDPKTVKQYAWGRTYCCVECFLNMKKPEKEPEENMEDVLPEFIRILKELDDMHKNYDYE